MDIVDVKMVGVSLCQPPPLSVIHLKKDRIFRVSVFIYHNFQEALPRSKEVNPFCSKLCKTVKSGGLRCLQRSSALIFHATISSATATFLTLDHFRSHHIRSLTLREWATVHNQFNLVIDIMVKKYDDAYFWNHRLMWLHPAVRWWSFDEAEWTHRFELI